MLKYECISEVREAQERLRKNYYRYNSGNHTRDSDTMLVFTQGIKSSEESKNNLDWCIQVGQQHEADILVLHENKIQFLGEKIHPGIMNTLMPGDWQRQYNEWTGTRSIDFEDDSSGRGELYTTRPWRRAFADRATQGVYDLASGKRIKNRREIITLFWRYGYAAQRGQPLSVAHIRHTGTREELEDITNIADKYWNRRGRSDVAKKLVSVWRSTTRYAAWPGSW